MVLDEKCECCLQIWNGTHEISSTAVMASGFRVLGRGLDTPELASVNLKVARPLKRVI